MATASRATNEKTVYQVNRQYTLQIGQGKGSGSRRRSKRAS